MSTATTSRSGPGVKLRRNPAGVAARPPVVIQTSALDCGPASLSSLLQGIGAPGNYEALRDICATDVDGTSIDALEAVAVALGTDAEQLVLPAEHIVAMPSA